MTPQIKQRIEQIRRGEVPEGYKRTRAGIIPSDWFLHPLTQHLTESRITGTNGAVAKKLTVKLWNKGVLEKREVHEGSESTTYYKRKAGQLIYSKLDFLNCAFGIIPQQLDGYESTQDLPCFDINGVDPCYLLTYLTQRNFYTHFGMIADGGRKARRIGPKDMLSFPLVYPPLSEQKKIAEILQTQGKLIELQQKKIEELKKLKKAYLSKMFPKKGCNVPEIRFPGFTDPWEQRKLSEFVDKAVDNRGKTPPLDENGTHPLIEVAALGGVHPDYSKVEKYLNDDSFENNLRAYIKEGDILFTTVGSIGLVSLMDSREEAAIAQNIVAFRAKENFVPEYLYSLFSNEENQYKAKRIVMGAVQPSIKVSQLVDVEYMLTQNVKEQQKIGEYFSKLDHLITLHQRKLEEMKKYKKSLMQLLLTGIVRM